MEPPPFDACQAAFHYKEPIRHLIQGIKYGRRHAVGRLLGQLVAHRLANLAPPPEVILPVPLHRGRYRERGFNQSVEIARHLSRVLHIPLDLHAVIRHRPTLPQVRLSMEERAKNVRGAFSLRRPITARHVAIFDDVVTTGATVAAIAELLRRQGMERIEVWAVARA
jgi:ComF family protein